MTAWPTTPLLDVLDGIIDNRGRTAPTAESGIALIATDCIKEGGLYPIKKNLRYVSEQTYKTWFRGHPQPGDVIITNKGTPGLVCQVPDVVDFCIAQDMVALRPKPSVITPDYLLSALRSPQFKNQVESLHVGTMIPHLKKTDFDKLTIPLPPLAVQEQIGDMYCSLCRKIELNRCMNQTLEATAAAIFKAWFIDFEPVKAKAAGAKSFPSMPQPVFDALPSSLVPAPNSPSGEIPKGWRVGVVGEEVEVVGGSTPSTSEPRYWDGVHCWATPKDLSKLDSPILVDTERNITDAGLAGISSGLLPVGSLVLSSRAPIGYLALVRVPTAINQGFIGMRCTKLLSAEFMLHWSQERMDDIKGRANGTTFQEISKGSFRPMPIVVPDETTAKAFDSLVKPLYEMVAANVRENGTLAALRDSLLPKLLSGEVRMATAEFRKEAAGV
jgi:type I restriction enzyme, S subunit